MPRIIADNWETQTASEIEASYDDLPYDMVLDLANAGDVEARAWLDVHPRAET